MARHLCSTILLLSCLAMIVFAGAEDTKGSRKLFVFGDSFADTGNWEVDKIPTAYVEPYGMTWPGKPTGRSSDGYCLTDILATIFNTSVPPTYRKYTENAVNASELQYGINFAYGGSGLTDYAFQNRSLTLQVNDFLALVQKNLYTKSDLENSVIVISNLGNDLAGYRVRFSLPESGIGVCYDRMRESLLQNLRNLRSLGMKRLILNSIRCGDNDTTCIRHNQAVKEQVEELFSEIHGSNVVIFDYVPLLQAAKMKFGHKEWPENQSCCQGIPGPVFNICGTVDETGKKQYTLCDKPEVAFFFNDGHISHRGWLTILDLFTTEKIFDALL